MDDHGRAWVTGASIAAGQPQAVILRHGHDGAPDLHWGIQGRLQVSPSGLAIKPNDLLPLSDGSVRVAGVVANVEPVRAMVFHLKADGAVDGAFGTAGTWQRGGATDGSTATDLAANDEGAVAVSVAARGEHAAAEIWSFAGPSPQRVGRQPLDPASDGEDVRVAWAGGLWVLGSGDGPTFAGLRATLHPSAMSLDAGRHAAASAPPDPGQGGFSPFSSDQQAHVPTADRSGDTGDAEGTHAAATRPDAVEALVLAAAFVAAIIAIRRRRRSIPTVLRKPGRY